MVKTKYRSKMKMLTARRAVTDSYVPLLAVLFAALSANLLGQTYEQVAPKPVPEQAPAVAAAPTPPPPAAPAADPQEVLVAHLTGIRLVPSPAEVTQGGVHTSGLDVDQLVWLKRWRVSSMAEEYIGHPLTREGLVQLVRDLVVISRESDRPVVDVFAPPQDVTSGTIQVVVMAAKLGALHVENNQYFDTHIFVRQMRLTPGQEITESTLLGDLDRLNQNPFRQVDLVYARGSEAGETDLVLRVRDTRPERVYVGYEDTGNKATGLGRVFAGFNLGDLFNEDHQFSYQYTRGTDWDRLQAQSASYNVLLPWRNFLSVFGDWSRAETKPADLFALDGTSWQVGLRYTVPLPATTNFSQSLVLGADYKWSNNNLAFGGTQVFTSPVNIADGMVQYNATEIDEHGSTAAGVALFESPGGIGGDNHDHDFMVQRPGAKADYQYGQITFTRLQKLKSDYTLVLTGIGQIADQRLAPIEQFGLGGSSSVRGYDDRVVNGDDGISAQLELRTPSKHVLSSIPDQTQFLVFLDAGREWIKDPMPGETDTTLVGAGPGVRLQISKYGTVKCDYGWELDRLPGTRSGRVHLSAILSF